jgi:hypothetical protein
VSFCPTDVRESDLARFEMHATIRPDGPPRGLTILDLLVVTAGFACGLVLFMSSRFLVGRVYILPSGTGSFQSLLGFPPFGLLWALVAGLAALIVGRSLRYRRHIRPAEWLAVALAIVLFDSGFGGFLPERAGSTDGEIVWVDWNASGVPVGFDLWSPHLDESRDYLASVALRTTAAAVLIGVAVAMLGKIRPGWLAVLVIALAILLTLGPVRLAEAMSREVSSSAVRAGYRASAGETAWTRTGLALYLDARAWAGYSIRVFCLLVVGVAAAASLARRDHKWLWTEWAAFASACVLASASIADEFIARPAFDRSTRVIALGAYLVVLALLGALFAAGSAALARRMAARFAVAGQRPAAPTATANHAQACPPPLA